MTANTMGNSWAAVYSTSKRTPKPAISAPQPITIVRGGAYAFAGGKTNPSTIIHAPKSVKTNGKTAKMLNPVRSDARMRLPRIIRKALAFRGAHGTRFIADSTSLGLGPVYSTIVVGLRSGSETPVRRDCRRLTLERFLYSFPARSRAT